MSSAIKTEIFLIEGEPKEVSYSGFKMGSIFDSVEVDIDSIGGKSHKDCTFIELRDAAEQIYFHETQDRVCRGEFQAEARGDELYRHN